MFLGGLVADELLLDFGDNNADESPLSLSPTFSLLLLFFLLLLVRGDNISSSSSLLLSVAVEEEVAVLRSFRVDDGDFLPARILGDDNNKSTNASVFLSFGIGIAVSVLFAGVVGADVRVGATAVSFVAIFPCRSDDEGADFGVLGVFRLCFGVLGELDSNKSTNASTPLLVLLDTTGGEEVVLGDGVAEVDLLCLLSRRSFLRDDAEGGDGTVNPAF